MKEYIKPFIKDEDIELEDVIAASNGGEGDVDTSGQEKSVTDIWPTQP